MPDEESTQRDALLGIIAKSRRELAAVDQEIAALQAEPDALAGCLTNMTRNEDGTVLTAGGCPANAPEELQTQHSAEVAAAKDRFVRNGGAFSTVTTSVGGSSGIDFLAD